MYVVVERNLGVDMVSALRFFCREGVDVSFMYLSACLVVFICFVVCAFMFVFLRFVGIFLFLFDDGLGSLR